MLKKRCMSLVMCVLMVCICLNALAANAKLGVTNAKNVNFRSDPSTSAEIIEMLDKNVRVLVVSSSDGFYKVKYDGETGYISSDYVSILSSNTGVITASNVNMRKSASTKSDKVASLSKDDIVRLYEEKDEFYFAVFGNTAGYIHKDYVDLYSAKAQSVDYTRAADSNTVFTDEELKMVAIVCDLEADATMAGYKAVASVIYNRIMSPKFPGTVLGVLTQPSQFSTVPKYPEAPEFTGENDEEVLEAYATVFEKWSRFLNRTPDPNAVEAVNSVFVDGVLTLPENVFFFRASSMGKSWRNLTYYGTIAGNCYFY